MTSVHVFFELFFFFTKFINATDIRVGLGISLLQSWDLHRITRLIVTPKEISKTNASYRAKRRKLH